MGQPTEEKGDTGTKKKGQTRRWVGPEKWEQTDEEQIILKGYGFGTTEKTPTKNRRKNGKGVRGGVH